jgi:hypothetical protein
MQLWLCVSAGAIIVGLLTEAAFHSAKAHAVPHRMQAASITLTESFADGTPDFLR